MRLINVRALLSFEESGGINCETKILVEFDGVHLAKTKYAILSHCWAAVTEEVQFKEMEKLPRMKHARKHCIRGCSGYQKILKCCEQAHYDGLEWVWVDTCCIDKRSSSEVSEAINSMFEWYANSERCYAYIHDHDEPTFPIRSDIAKYHDSGGWPRWFSRGWTLQELVAPKAVHFFNKNWEPVGNKHSLASVLNNITRVPSSVLEKGLPSKRPSVAQIISWAADRRTTREEDRAYSLLGLLGVHMPMLYGEGKNAFRRLQLEIIKMSNDHSIFAWGHSRKTGWSSSFLADDPSCFRDCSNVIIMEQDEFVEALKKDMKEEALLEFPRRRLRVFTVTNNGIHIWLPVVPCSGSTHFFIAKLACRLEEPCSRPLTITLGLFQSNHFRYFCYFATSCKAPAQFQELLLPSDYSKEENITNFVFKLDLACISHEDFIWHHSLPEDVIYKGDSLILTNTNSFAIIVYKHIEKDVFFALILSSCHGRHMARVIDCDGTQTFDRIQVDTLEEAFRVPEECANDEDSFVQHTHFPGSIQGARMIYRRLPGMKNACRITIDIVQCTGCCAPWKNGDIQLMKGLDMPGVMRDVIPWSRKFFPVFNLIVDLHPMCFISGTSGVQLGDYGYCRKDGRFKREGNIFDLASIEPNITSFDLIKHKISDHNGNDMSNEQCAKVCGLCHINEAGVSYHASGWSLPNTECMFPQLYSIRSAIVAQADRIWDLSNQLKTASACLRELLDLPNSSTLDLSYLGNVDVPTPLYTIMAPLVWHPEGHDPKIRRNFSKIRHHFCGLMNWANGWDDWSEDSFDTETIYASNDLGVTTTSEASIKFLESLFGGEYLRNLIGDIAFFRQLPSVTKSQRDERVHTSLDDTGTSQPSAPTSDNHSTLLRDPRVQFPRGLLSSSENSLRIAFHLRGVREIELKFHRTLLTKWVMDGVLVNANNPTFLWNQDREIRNWAEKIRSECFGIDLLQVISAVVCRSEGSRNVRHMHGKRHRVEDNRCKIQSLVQETRTLLELFDFVKDDGERRVLEEDITGKILVACWYGVNFEVEQVLKKAVHCIVDNQTLDRHVRGILIKRLKEIAAILEDVIADNAADKFYIPLRRVMADAEAGISKHQLLLIAQAARAST